ncbi:MAG: protein translocase subunit SecF [Acidobacteria bacterium]|nr:MAG: protein translocase subunit SecF [Acidobacteriota bacterium]
MEFFHEPNIDWLGRKWYFISVSMALLVAGLISIAVHRGLVYGIEFRSGTQVMVKFSKEPDVGAIRRQLASDNWHGASIQSLGLASEHSAMIELPLERGATGGEALDTGKNAIVKALTELYGGASAGKADFNNASAKTLEDHMLVADPLGLASRGIEIATSTYQNLAQAMVKFRDTPPQGGLIANFQQLSAVSGVTPAVLGALEKDFYLSGFTIRNTQIVGPKVGSDLRREAVYVTLAGLAAMLVYIWFRFELIYGVSAVIAVFHDVLITIGLFSLFNKEITLDVIAALLTLVGYSMNDTIVVFDRIRENLPSSKRENFVDLVNRSINQTLSRTILTSGLTFLAVLALYLFGGDVIHGFSFAMVVGVVIGTYSSIAIASPILVFWQTRAGSGRVKEKRKVYEREVAAAKR